MEKSQKEQILSHYYSVCDSLKAYPKARLIAVSKRQEPEKIQVLVEAGHRDFGENYLQEWQEKKQMFPEELRWHFIGGLQSRKVAPLAKEGIYAIHSLGSESSIKKFHQLEPELAPLGLIQMNLEDEETKSGISEKDLEKWAELGLLEKVNGLMSIPQQGASKQERVRHFKHMREIAERYNLSELSMGMSRDWEIALAEGATMIRIGTSIFGDRRN